MYGIDGDSDLSEREVENLSGYYRSRPVRIGNGAAEQRQLDIYGEFVLAIDEALVHGREIDASDWEAVRAIVEYVREHWQQPDAGIWEVRGEYRQFVHSKLMCWVALDRGLAIATERDWDAPVDAWRETREEIETELLERGYDEGTEAFTQSYEGTTLDATALLIPTVGLLPFDDERVQNTIDAVERRLLVDEVLCRRYEGDDGLPGEEGAFVLCSCWLIDALCLSGRVEEARERFRSLVKHANSLGLLAEEVDRETKRQLGNFPQAFSHVGLINTATYLGWSERRRAPAGSDEGDGEDEGLESKPIGVRLGDPIGFDGN